MGEGDKPHTLYTNVRYDVIGRAEYSTAVAAIERIINRMSGVKNVFVKRNYIHDAQQLIEIIEADVDGRGDAVSNTGMQFELDCVNHLIESEFQVRTTLKTGDFGADILAEKYDLLFAIQCKDTLKPVGIKAVQEIVAAKRHYKADYSVLCITGTFTNAAVELASSTSTILCHGQNLSKMLDAI